MDYHLPFKLNFVFSLKVWTSFVKTGLGRAARARSFVKLKTRWLEWLSSDSWRESQVECYTSNDSRWSAKQFGRLWMLCASTESFRQVNWVIPKPSIVNGSQDVCVDSRLLSGQYSPIVSRRRLTGSHCIFNSSYNISGHWMCMSHRMRMVVKNGVSQHGWQLLKVTSAFARNFSWKSTMRYLYSEPSV